MNAAKIIGFTVLTLVYLWLAQAILRNEAQPLVMRAFTVVAAGIIIFVPLYKKYIRKNK